MMRATPYCSVSPMATSAYMPPKVTPESVTSNSMSLLAGARDSSRALRWLQSMNAPLEWRAPAD